VVGEERMPSASASAETKMKMKKVVCRSRWAVQTSGKLGVESHVISIQCVASLGCFCSSIDRQPRLRAQVCMCVWA